jgi:hypothetical protein
LRNTIHLYIYAGIFIYMYICTDYKYAFENAIGEARS